MSDKEKDGKEEDDSDSEAYKLYTHKKIINTHEIYLSTSFTDPEEYREIFNLLDHAKAEDSFVFYLNNYGGRVDTGIQFASKLKTTKAHTKSIVEAPVYSMGAIFPFLTKEFVMRPHTFLMFHDASGLSYGKMNEQELKILSFNRLFKEMLEVHCSKVLSKREIADILKGRDLYLTDSEVSKRLAAKAKK